MSIRAGNLAGRVKRPRMDNLQDPVCQEIFNWWDKEGGRIFEEGIKWETLVMLVKMNYAGNKEENCVSKESLMKKWELIVDPYLNHICPPPCILPTRESLGWQEGIDEKSKWKIMEKRFQAFLQIDLLNKIHCVQYTLFTAKSEDSIETMVKDAFQAYKDEQENPDRTPRETIFARNLNEAQKKFNLITDEAQNKPENIRVTAVVYGTLHKVNLGELLDISLTSDLGQDNWVPACTKGIPTTKATASAALEKRPEVTGCPPSQPAQTRIIYDIDNSDLFYKDVSKVRGIRLQSSEAKKRERLRQDQIEKKRQEEMENNSFLTKTKLMLLQTKKDRRRIEEENIDYYILLHLYCVLVLSQKKSSTQQKIIEEVHYNINYNRTKKLTVKAIKERLYRFKVEPGKAATVLNSMKEKLRKEGRDSEKVIPGDMLSRVTEYFRN